MGVLTKKEGSKINRDLESNKIEERQALCKILLEWKKIKGKDATIKNFYDSIPCSEDDSDEEEALNVTSPPDRTFQKAPGSIRISSEDDEPAPASNSPRITIASIPVFPGPSGRKKAAQKCKRKRSSSEEWWADWDLEFRESSEDEPAPKAKENEDRSVRGKKVVARVAADSVSAQVWTAKLKIMAEMNKDTFRLLSLMAYLKHDVILKPLLTKLGVLSKVKEGQVNAGVKFLLKHGMILKKKTVGEVFCISPDLQKQMRVELTKKGKEEKVLKELLKYFAGLQQWSVRGRYEDEEYPEEVLDENVEHVLTVWTYAVNYPPLIRGYSKLLCDVLGLLESEGEKKDIQQEGLQLGLVALEKFKTDLGADHVDFFKLDKNIAVVMYLVGRCEESAKKLEELANNLVHLLEETDENENLLLEIKAEQAEALTHLDKHEEAQKIQKEVLTKMKLNRGENAYETLAAEYRYTNSLWNTGNLKEALEGFKGLARKERSLKGPTHDCTLKAQMSAAQVHADLGDCEAALEILKESYEAISTRWEESVELFARIACNLGEVLIELNQFGEAVQLLEQDFKKIKKELKNHHLTFTLLIILGVAYRGNGEDRVGLQRALEMHKKAYAFFKEQDEDEAVAANDEVAVDLSMLGRHKKALKMFEENIQKIERKKEKKDSDFELLLDFKMNYAKALERNGAELDEVLRRLREVKEELVKAKVKKVIKIIRVSDEIERVERRMLLTSYGMPG